MLKTAVEAVSPDSICIELCAARHKALVQKDNWKKMDIFKVIKEKRALFPSGPADTELLFIPGLENSLRFSPELR